MREIKKIILGVTFNEVISAELNKAIFLAKKYDAVIYPVHVIEYVPCYLGNNHKAFRKLKEEIREKMNIYINLLKIENVKVFENLIVEEGKPYDIILKIAERIDADLIIIGAGAISLAEKRVISFSAEKIVCASQIPVWVVHPDEIDSRVSKILCCYDFSEASNYTLEKAMELVQIYNSKITILNVKQRIHEYLGMTSSTGFIQWEPECKLQLSHKNLFTELKKIMSHYKEEENLSTVKILEGQVTNVIMKEIQYTKPDLLVMGNVGRNVVSKMLLGSTTQKMIRKSPISILVLNCIKKKSMIKLS